MTQLPRAEEQEWCRRSGRCDGRWGGHTDWIVRYALPLCVPFRHLGPDHRAPHQQSPASGAPGRALYVHAERHETTRARWPAGRLLCVLA